MRSPLGSLASTILNRTPVPFARRTERLNVLTPHLSNAERQMSAMGTVGTLFAIVNRTSNATAQVDWKLWRKSASGKKEDRQEVLSHPALTVWNKPNTFYTRQEFVETFQQHVDLTGEGWWVIEYVGSRPIAMWPVRPDRMTPVRHPTDFLTGYVYTGPEGEQIPLELHEVVQIRMPNPLDPYRGMGPVQSIMYNLDADRFAAEYQRNFFLNSAEPGGVIEVESTLDDTAYDRLQAHWSANHKGVSNAHRVAILENNAKYKHRTHTMREMQYTELSGVTRDKILEVFGFPKSMLGIVEDVNRANAETSKAMFAEQLVVPRLERIKGALNNDFLLLFGESGRGLEFDYEDPVPEDAEARNAERDSQVAAFTALITAGVNADDAAAWCGLPAMRVVQPAQVGGGNSGSGLE